MINGGHIMERYTHEVIAQMSGGGWKWRGRWCGEMFTQIPSGLRAILA
jgi:hypothetical protein